MSKVKAYRCDYCGEIKDESGIVGISQMEDIFDRLKSYHIIKQSEKADVHGCTDCYKYCMTEANKINRHSYEDLYKQKRDEAGYMFRKQAVFNFLNKRYTPPVIIGYKALKG